MSSSTTENPVLVVGGRTSGLMMAAELARHGVPVRIIDKSPGIDPHVRATVLHARTLEILDQLGLAEPLVQHGQLLTGYSVFANGKFIGHSDLDPVDSKFSHAVGLSQAEIEAHLERHLNGFGVTVERNTQLTALEQHDGGVRATILKADGCEELCDTPWLIGCDGAHSTVRHQTEEIFPGEADPYAYMLADVVVAGDLNGELTPEEVYIFLCDDGDLFLFVLNEGRRLITANVPPGTDISQPLTLAEVQQVVSQRSHADLRLSDPRWLTYFHIHYRVAPHYRHGRTFLAGDAAHVHSLLGGQGMNTGIQDAHNLAWKLAQVMRGHAPLAWLDTYDAERRKVAEDVVAVTKGLTEQMEAFAGLSTAEREKLLAHMFVPAAEHAAGRRHEEEIDLDYRACPICIDTDDAPSSGPHAGARAPDVEPLLVDGRRQRLFNLLYGTKHRLLLFAPRSGDQATVVAAATAAVQTHGDWIDVAVVGVEGAEFALPPDVSLVTDPQQALRKCYDCPGGGLYLIRPDGYVAYRSGRVDGLDEYVQRVM